MLDMSEADKRGDPFTGSGCKPKEKKRVIFTRKVKYPIYSAVYAYNDMQDFYSIENYTCKTVSDLDAFALDVMEQQGLRPPYHRISAHIVGYEYIREKR